jgi:uncharacterized protein (TIGR02996 family)
MTEESRLYQAIIESPDELELRLNYAQWAESHDPPRADFIRADIDSIRLLKEREGSWRAAFDRARHLLSEHRERWVGAVDKMVDQASFSRGFVEIVELDARTFLDTAPDLYQLAPIRHLTLKGISEVAETLFASPHLDRIVSLTAEERLTDREVRLIAESDHLAKLAYLDLNPNDVTPSGIEALAASNQLPGLRKVNVSHLISETGNFEVAPWGRQTLYPEPSPLARELEAKYGYRAWLHEHELSPHGGSRLREEF